jgi:hypothetical protein
LRLTKAAVVAPLTKAAEVAVVSSVVTQALRLEIPNPVSVLEARNSCVALPMVMGKEQQCIYQLTKARIFQFQQFLNDQGRPRASTN